MWGGGEGTDLVKVVGDEHRDVFVEAALCKEVCWGVWDEVPVDDGSVAGVWSGHSSSDVIVDLYQFLFGDGTETFYAFSRACKWSVVAPGHWVGGTTNIRLPPQSIQIPPPRSSVRPVHSWMARSQWHG